MINDEIENMKHLPFKYPLISGIPDPAAAGANCVTIYTEEKTKAKLNTANTKKPAKYECCIIEKVAAYFQPEKFSTARLIKTAATPVPESKHNIQANNCKMVNQEMMEKKRFTLLKNKQ